MIKIDFEELLINAGEDLTETDRDLASYINTKGLPLDLSINDLAGACLTSRTSVLRFAKKLGFRGYADLKYFLNQGPKEEENPERDYGDIFEKLSQVEEVVIFGNGTYEEVVKLATKSYLEEAGFFAETYQGGDEIINFNQKFLEDKAIFIVDFCKDPSSHELLNRICGLSCLKFTISTHFEDLKVVDYRFHVKREEEGGLRLSPVLKRLEDFFEAYKKWRETYEDRKAG